MARSGSFLLVVAALGAGEAHAATAAVTYLSGSTVYLGAGGRDGLVEGARLAPEREETSVVLQAFEVTPRRAACRVVEGTAAAVRVGDTFRYEPVVRVVPGAEAAAPSERKPWGGRGRLGIRYLFTHDGINSGADFQQPALDAMLNAPSLYGTPWGARVDVRARRTFRSGDDTGRSRVYALFGGWDPVGPGWRFSLGRQYAPDLANVSVFDGVMAAYDAARWSAGGFLGTQPDDDFGYSNDVREYGAFAGWHAAPGSPRRWTLSTGAVASYEQSTINREYLFVHGTYVGPRVGAFFTQEIDVNRGWKEDAGESAVEPTSTFLSVRFRATDWMDVSTGLDTRRDVRLYRDYVSPETEFDDAFRQGYRLNADARAGKHVRFGLGARTARGGSAGAADSITGSASFEKMSRAALAARLRATRWTNDRMEGWLYAVDASGNLGERFRLGAEAGWRSEDSLLSSDLGDDVSWLGVTFDADLTRRLFATFSIDKSHGTFEDVLQAYATLAYRF